MCSNTTATLAAQEGPRKHICLLKSPYCRHHFDWRVNNSNALCRGRVRTSPNSPTSGKKYWVTVLSFGAGHFSVRSFLTKLPLGPEPQNCCPGRLPTSVARSVSVGLFDLNSWNAAKFDQPHRPHFTSPRAAVWTESTTALHLKAHVHFGVSGKLVKTHSCR